MEEADKLCDRIAIIDRSSIIALDTPQNLKNELGGENIIIESSDNDLLANKLSEVELADNIFPIEQVWRAIKEKNHINRLQMHRKTN